MDSTVFVQVSTLNRKRFTFENETLFIETKEFLAERAMRVTCHSLPATPRVGLRSANGARSGPGRELFRPGGISSLFGTLSLPGWSV
jgi:hypothetical protein